MLGASYRPARTPQVWTELRPEVPASEVLGRIAQTVPRTGGPLIIVGHEPQFSRLVGLAITGEAVPLIRCSKGGAVAVQFDARVVPGGGQILWALTRGQLGRLAGGKGRPERDDAE
jgi:phosphohistidine phosphatase SixA